VAKKTGKDAGKAGQGATPGAEATASVQARPYELEVRHFRRASVVAIGLAAVSLALGWNQDNQAAVEVGLGLGGFAILFRAVMELFPSTHAKVAYLHPRSFFLATWHELDAEAESERAARVAAGRYDHRPLIALVVGAVCLAIMEYFGHTVHFNALADRWDPELRDSPWFELMGFAWWSAFRVLGYLVIPMAVVVFVFKERVRDHGLETHGFLEHAWIYAISYVVVLICVVLVSRNDPHFQTYYPFYDQASRSWADFWMWEVLYAAQFFSLEFFFRGFWLRSMKSSMGSYAIFAMVVPYCMIHFGKPFLETMAAIAAGVVLGTLSMKTRSIWSGFLIHVSVAISMDMAALLATRGLPTTTWP
jgi:membrane protease YdiL (CAAX protease family)